MKGIVFTELFDMVEATFGADMIEDVLDDCELESEGAYTSVGTYDHRELLQIVSALSKHVDIPVKDLVHKYGHHLFSRFHAMMPQFFEAPKFAFEFLESVHDYIHVEVKKLYPDAALPKFETQREGTSTLIMTYRSQCPFADFAHGLMEGCIDFYEEDIQIQGVDHNSDGEFCRVFTLIKQ
jgi:hypothetical protein